MGVNLALGLIIGVALFAAANHLFVGAMGERARAHQAMGVFALAAAGYTFCAVWLYGAQDVAGFSAWSRIQGSVGCLLVVTLFGLANEVLGGWNKKVLLAVGAGLVTLAAVSLLMPAGIFYGEITGLRTVAGPLGPVTLPVATANPAQIVFDLLVFLPLPLIIVRAVVLFLRGRRRLALLTGVAIAVPALPALVDTFLLGVDTFALPVTEASLALSFVFLSVAISEDVARTAGLREDLARSEARYRRLVETAPEAIGLYDAEARRFILVNGRAEDLFGREAGELTGTDPQDLLRWYALDAGQEGGDAVAMILQALQGEPVVVEWLVTRPDGGQVPCEVRFIALNPPSGTLVRVSFLDIGERKARETERRRLEQRVRRSERLQTIGNLADGIAHDFNNILTPLVAYGELAADRLAGHAAEGHVAEMRDAVGRARDLVRQIVTFGARGGSSEEVVAVEPVMKQALRFLRAAISSGVEIDARIEAPRAYIRADATRLSQVVMNLGVNAAHAMEGRGLLEISLVEEGSEVELKVRDTGPGMDPATLGRIFEPFFTTKAEGQGTGLGLSIVQEAVQAMGGRIHVESAPGQGTSFFVRLPAWNRPEEPAGEAREPRRGSEGVLLVDDDPAALVAVQSLMESLGYRVVACGDPDAALTVAGTQKFDVCVTDFDMPGMNGLDLASGVRARIPGLPVLLTSGSLASLRQEGSWDGPWRTLAKPFTRLELGDALGELLEPRQDREDPARGPR